MTGYFMKNHNEIYKIALDMQQKKGLLRHLESHMMPSAQAGYIHIKGKDYLNLASNDYLGLSQNQEMIDYAAEIADMFGGASVSARIVAGQFDFYSETERKLAAFKGKEAAIIGASGFQVNSTVIEALLKPFGKNVTVFFDKFNHASMYFGLQAAGIQAVRYKHNDMAHLESLLEKYKDHETHKFIMSESVFSMDGDICPLEDLIRLAQKYTCFTVIDDAHAVGIMGENGAGLTKNYPDIDIVLGTCSKALGAFGGYAACNADMAEYLRNFASGLIYSTALPPAIWGAIHKALDIIPSLHQERQEILTYSQHIRNLCQAKGLECGGSQSHILPIILGTNEKALTAARHMRQNGYFIKAIRTPTVPSGTARLRLSVNPFVAMCDAEKIVNNIGSL